MEKKTLPELLPLQEVKQLYPLFIRKMFIEMDFGFNTRLKVHLLVFLVSYILC